MKGYERIGGRIHLTYGGESDRGFALFRKAKGTVVGMHLLTKV